MSGAAGLSLDVQLRWSDVDELGHVNNAVYLTYLETARIAFFSGLGEGLSPLDFVLRRVEVDFVSQLTRADRGARVEVRLAGVGRSSVRTAERVLAASDGRLVVDATAIVVHLAPGGERSAPLPDALRARLAALAAQG